MTVEHSTDSHSQVSKVQYILKFMIPSNSKDIYAASSLKYTHLTHWQTMKVQKTIIQYIGKL